MQSPSARVLLPQQLRLGRARKCARKSPRIAHELPSDEQPIMRARDEALQMPTILLVR
jgi:hypothetical protein